MKLLILSDVACDLIEVLKSCSAEVTCVTLAGALHVQLACYDAYCVIAQGDTLDARVRARLEEECDKGKRIFTSALNSWRYIYSAPPVNTTRSRLICLDPTGGEGLPFAEGDLLDDESNLVIKPWVMPEGAVQLLVYQEHIVAHDHTKMSREEILADSIPGMWLLDDNTLMCSFRIHNFNRARFAPRARWQALISWIAKWLTGSEPAWLPAPVVRYGVEADLTAPESFESCRADAVERGMKWLDRFLIDEGQGGILEGMNHNINPEGVQTVAKAVRADCSGEAAGAYRFYAYLKGSKVAAEKAANLESFCHDTMQIKGGLFDGMMRWTAEAWGVCYGDDVARAVLGELLTDHLIGRHERFDAVCAALDFLVKTTAKDGVRVSRTDCIRYNAESLAALAEVEHCSYSAHHNAYYAAVLLLAYLDGGKAAYLDTAGRCLETLMSVYPDTTIEHSQTQEAARLILPLALLYEATGEEKHKDFLYRVAQDLQKRRYPCGGYAEWDEHYAAHYSRDSRDECSLLTENGDPVADLLYTCNWLPVGFAYAWFVTKDPWFYELWEDIARFCMRTQNASDNPKNDGSWCRAFDMERMEAYACPHDAGWAAYASESGWTNAEILMGLMLPDVMKKAGKI